MEKELLYKSRSFSSCIQVAYQLMTDHFGIIYRSTWLPVLTFSLMCGLFVTINLPNLETFTINITQQITYLTLFAISLIGMLACCIWVFSRLTGIINEQPRRWNFIRTLMLTINSMAIGLVLCTILVATITIAHRHTGGTWLNFIIDNWLAILGIFIIIWLATLPLIYIGLRYLCNEKAYYWREFPKTYMKGLRHLSFIFLITLILSIISGILILIIGLPLYILQAANTESLIGEISGDPNTLPTYFIPLVGITTFAITFLATYVNMFPWIAYFFMYGSIEKQEEERDTTAITPIDLPDTHLM